MKSLSDITNENITYQIHTINEESLELKSRLLALGLKTNSVIKVFKKTIANGPWIIELIYPSNALIALRSEEYKSIMVKEYTDVSN